jgi:ribosomal protein S18 acetylase RimI-like enzyme
MLTLALRPATPDDAPFLAALHAATRSAEVAAFGWDGHAAHDFLAQQHTVREAAYAAGFPGAEDRLITVDGTPVGRALVHRTDRVLHLVDLAVLPAHQGRGLGTAVLRSLLDDAASAGGLGFVALDETALDVPMEARP